MQEGFPAFHVLLIASCFSFSDVAKAYPVSSFSDKSFAVRPDPLIWQSYGLCSTASFECNQNCISLGGESMQTLMPLRTTDRLDKRGLDIGKK